FPRPAHIPAEGEPRCLTYTNPQTANAQQCRRQKALMRNTAASSFPSRKAGEACHARGSAQHSARTFQLGKTRGGQGRGRNLGTRTAYVVQSKNLHAVHACP